METESTLNPYKRSRMSHSESGGGGGDEENDDSFLLEWLLIEVLCRLPMDAVYRFKCVSRQCLSFVSDPSFLPLYHSRASVLGVPSCKLAFVVPIIVARGPKMSSQKQQNDNEHGISPELYFLRLPNFSEEWQDKIYSIKAVDKGFFLYALSLYNSRIVEYYICNPLTKQWFALPRHNFFIGLEVSDGLIAEQVEDGNLRSFKVILVRCPHPKRNFLEFQVFSSETGEWEDLVVSCESRVRLCKMRDPVVLNNILHWIDCELGIVAYDPTNSRDKLRIIEFPNDARKGPDTARYGYWNTKCGVFQGRLEYFEFIRPNFDTSSLGHFEPWSFKIWQLQDYSSNHWLLQHSTREEDIIGGPADEFGIEITLMSFHPWDPHIIYLHWEGKLGLVTYNMQTKRVESLGLQTKYCVDWRHMISLCTCFLLGPVCIPSFAAQSPDDHVSLLI